MRLILQLVHVIVLCRTCHSFFSPGQNAHIRRFPVASAYVRVNEDSSGQSQPKPTKKERILLPEIGDVVRYNDLDGGREDGQVLVGRIAYIQTTSAPTDQSKYLVEITELEDTGDGYYAEYSSRKQKRALRNLALVSPVTASFVQSENAFKIPKDSATGIPIVRQEVYDWQEYKGPSRAKVDEAVVASDARLYSMLKGRVLRFVALTGLAGTIVADLTKGRDFAAIYGAGALSSVAYLFLLSLKTDTIASQNAKFGNSVSSLRFLMPLFVLVGTAVYNASLGDANPVLGKGTFDLVTTEQFAAAILGFLTYRIPLFIIQIQDAFDAINSEESSLELPGSAGVAMRLLSQQDNERETSIAPDTSQKTILLVSGPQAAGRSELVSKFLEESSPSFVVPKSVDKRFDPAEFERIQERDEFLFISPDQRLGITKESILESGSLDSVVVVDADVGFAQRLTRIPDFRLVGVWVGLKTVDEFEKRLNDEIDEGKIIVPDDETRESVIRARIKEIVSEIEFGISSGIFEFTILNTGDEASLQQLKDAAEYSI